MFLSTLIQRLAPSFGILLKVIAWHGGACHADSPLVCLAHHRIRWMLIRLDRMLVRFKAGRPMQRPAAARRTAGAAPTTTTAATPAGAARPKPIRMAFAWLSDTVPNARSCRAPLDILLADAEFAALAAASLQARRMLRPICRMFGLELPAILALPRRPKPATEKRRKAQDRPRARPRAPAAWTPSILRYPFRKRPAPD